MKELLLVEKSTVSIAKTTTDPYTLEGMFTELGLENRNGRVYTKEGFLPHLKQLQKVVEQGKAVGELDHPKVFETSLKNSSHVIEKIWFNESDNKVYGRIKLLNTDAGKNAKALVDAGVPLHISSRAAGTVTENKSVKIHKLFTYDLVADPGFENAVLNTVNESYGFDNNPETANFFIYDVKGSKSIKESNVEGPVEVPGVNYVSEEDLNGFSKFTQNALNGLKNDLRTLKDSQHALITQNDEIAESVNASTIQNSIKDLHDKITGIEKWSEHVVNEFNSDDNNKPSANRIKILEDKLTALENWSAHTTETVSSIEDWSKHVTETVTSIEDWSVEATTTVTALENWSEDATTTVTALENWSEDATTTVTALETWSEDATTTVTALESWSEDATTTVTALEESIYAPTTRNIKRNVKKLDESLSETYTNGLYKKIDSIIDDAKKQKAEETYELVKEEKEEDSTVLPFWQSMMPLKYAELWDAVSETKKSSIVKRANICEFSTEKSVKEFWDATFAGTTIEMIKESTHVAKAKSPEEVADAIVQRRLRIVEGYNKNFK